MDKDKRPPRRHATPALKHVHACLVATFDAEGRFVPGAERQWDPRSALDLSRALNAVIRTVMAPGKHNTDALRRRIDRALLHVELTSPTQPVVVQNENEI
jgi:hypothetical protein